MGKEDDTSASPCLLSGRKREREEEEEEEEPDQTISLRDNLTFSDTMVALRIMHAQFPQLDKVSIQPFIMRSQIYSSVKDRTQVDRDLEVMLSLRCQWLFFAIFNKIVIPWQKLRRDRVVRLFKLNTGQDDHAIMFQDDYLNQRLVSELGDVSSCIENLKEIGQVVNIMEKKKQDGIEVFEWFRTHVIPSKLEPSIGHEELGKVKDQHISLLINAGLLTRQLIDSNMYWFAIPSIGSVLKGLSQGRKELLSFLKRRRYKEMMLVDLEKKRLRLSPLDMRFHLRDLIGSGHLKSFQTASGLVVRVVKD